MDYNQARVHSLNKPINLNMKSKRLIKFNYSNRGHTNNYSSLTQNNKVKLHFEEQNETSRKG